MPRKYERTHPWIGFEFSPARLDSRIWLLLGEAQSKCEHIAGVPLHPEVAARMHSFYLARGIRATTAIEGNTLTQEDIELQLAGKLKLPPSREYLAQETDNIAVAYNQIGVQALAGELPPLSPDSIRAYNALVLRNLETEDHVVPGEFAGVQVGVAHYRGAPPEDIAFLVERLCVWLNGPGFADPGGEYRIVHGLIKAILAHLYLAWIHPFGDGNGRTARLVEFRILLEAGAPTPATHLLSDHYNNTRAEYYRQLDRASASGGDVVPFIAYALRGYVDGLQEQIDRIREQQFDVTWRNYVHDRMRGHDTKTGIRRRKLVLALSSRTSPVEIADLRTLDAEIAAAYAGKTLRTLSRDVDWLVEQDLVNREKRGVIANRQVVLAFLPRRVLE